MKTLEIYSPLKKESIPKSSFKFAQAGYDAEWSVVSARDVGGCHLRERVWIIAYPSTMDHLPQRGLDSMIKQTQVHRKGRTKLANLREAVNPQAVKLFNELQQLRLPSPTLQRLEGFGRQHELQESCGEEKARWRTQPYTSRPDWRKYESESCIRRRDDGIPSRLDANWRNRKERIICLGNAVTPQQAAIPLGESLTLSSHKTDLCSIILFKIMHDFLQEIYFDFCLPK